MSANKPSHELSPCVPLPDGEDTTCDSYVYDEHIPFAERHFELRLDQIKYSGVNTYTGQKFNQTIPLKSIDPSIHEGLAPNKHCGFGWILLVIGSAATVLMIFAAINGARGPDSIYTVVFLLTGIAMTIMGALLITCRKKSMPYFYFLSKTDKSTLLEIGPFGEEEARVRGRLFCEAIADHTVRLSQKSALSKQAQKSRGGNMDNVAVAKTSASHSIDETFQADATSTKTRIRCKRCGILFDVQPHPKQQCPSCNCIGILRNPGSYAHISRTGERARVNASIASRCVEAREQSPSNDKAELSRGRYNVVAVVAIASVFIGVNMDKVLDEGGFIYIVGGIIAGIVSASLLGIIRKK